VQLSTNRLSTRGDQARPEFQFRRILVLTDFFRGAQSALECARAIARKFNSKIFLLHVIPSGVFQFISPESAAEALRRAREFAEQEMQRLLNAPGAQGLLHEVIVAEGPIWPTISDVINSRQIDLIAMGTQSGGSEKKLVLGAVAEQIYRLADCPILTAPPETATSQNLALDRLLFATDFMPHNERTANVAHSLECNSGGQLTVLHVVEGPTESSRQSHTLVKDFLFQRMRKSLPSSCLEQCAPQFEVRFGKPVDEILSASKQLHSELILLGLRPTLRTAGYLPSAKAYGIVCQAHCPVLTLRQK
jgi:nucleotide-binding universal stress UspA family protein